MNNLTISKRIAVHLTAEQWELYTASRDCTVAAEALNDAVQHYFNIGQTREVVHHLVTRVMSRYADYGAMDTEPKEVLNQLLDVLYKDE